MTGRDHAKRDQEIQPLTALKLLLFLVWWFSGIGVGTGVFSPVVVGSAISSRQFLTLVLTFFSSGLLILALVRGPDDAFAER